MGAPLLEYNTKSFFKHFSDLMAVGLILHCIAPDAKELLTNCA